MGATGDVVKARYTYVYVFEDNQWKIAVSSARARGMQTHSQLLNGWMVVFGP